MMKIQACKPSRGYMKAIGTFLLGGTLMFSVTARASDEYCPATSTTCVGTWYAMSRATACARRSGRLQMRWPRVIRTLSRSALPKSPS